MGDRSGYDAGNMEIARIIDVLAGVVGHVVQISAGIVASRYEYIHEVRHAGRQDGIDYPAAVSRRVLHDPAPGLPAWEYGDARLERLYKGMSINLATDRPFSAWYVDPHHREHPRLLYSALPAHEVALWCKRGPSPVNVRFMEAR